MAAKEQADRLQGIFQQTRRSRSAGRFGGSTVFLSGTHAAQEVTRRVSQLRPQWPPQTLAPQNPAAGQTPTEAAIEEEGRSVDESPKPLQRRRRWRPALRGAKSPYRAGKRSANGWHRERAAPRFPVPVRRCAPGPDWRG